MRNTRITQQALQIALRQRAEVSVKNGDSRNHNQQVGPLRRNTRNGGEQKAQQKNKSSGLRSDRQERRSRCGCALINIGRPDLEGERGDLKPESNQNKQHAKEKHFVACEISSHLGQFAEVKLAT